MNFVVFLAIIGAITSPIIFYFIIKTAVRDAIIEARRATQNEDETDKISQIFCNYCNNLYDMDFPKCPRCKQSSR